MFIGACAGSTGGGIKVSRVVVLFKSVQKELDAINSRLSWLEEYLDKKHEEEENKRKENQQNEAV